MERANKKYRFDFGSSLQDLIDQKMNSLGSLSASTESWQELVCFLELGRVPVSTDVYEWWSEKKSSYPNLYELTKKYLFVPATSAPAERVFSCAGWLLNQRRTRLIGKHVDALIFLKMNKFI